MLRLEEEIFEKLKCLVNQNGYINTLSKLFVDNMFIKNNSEKNEELEKLYLKHQNSKEYLMRSELNALYNLMCQGTLRLECSKNIDYDFQYNETLNLCEEIHKSIFKYEHKQYDNESLQWREAFFYGSENQHTVQLKNFFKDKYLCDDNWLLSNKGFSISDTLKIVETLNGIIRLRLVNEQEILSGGKLTNDFYKLFLFTIDEISFHTDLDNKICSSFLKAFSSEDEIEKYNKLDDLNTRKAYPFLKFSDNQYFLPSLHMLLEAMYETPYHWMIKDDDYKGEFGNNRGAFAENFCEKTIKKVFGHENVYKNVEIYKGKNRLGEIDVLVAYGEVAIVIEIKSKGLSQEARQGDIDAIKKDFNLAVQKAYEQTVKCGLGILDMSSHKIKMNKKVLNLENKFKKIIPICLISENFPSLSYQVKDFLKQNFNKEIGRAYVIDIFFLDILCEYLDSPIMFLNFIGRRLRYWENLSIADECIALGYHLSNNLYFKDEGAFYALGGDSAIDLGVDFIKRRENLNYDLIDFKLLGLHTSGTLGAIVKQKNINLKLEHLELFDSLLIASEDSWHGINKAIQEIYARYDADRRFHSAALQVQIHKFGFTFCIDNNESNTVFEKLKKIVQLRKYITKSDKWFGVILSRSSPYIKAVHVFDYKWKFDSHLDMLKTMMLPKVGRNDLCYCGSNKKFKKCCI